MLSREFFFCLSKIVLHVRTWIRRYFKEAILWCNVTWSELGKQNVQANKVYFLYCIRQDHVGTCPFKVVSCSNQNCPVLLKRKYLVNHVAFTCQWRIIECEYCREPHPECHKKVIVIHCLNRFFQGLRKDKKQRNAFSREAVARLLWWWWPSGQPILKAVCT